MNDNMKLKNEQIHAHIEKQWVNEREIAAMKLQLSSFEKPSFACFNVSTNKQTEKKGTHYLSMTMIVSFGRKIDDIYIIYILKQETKPTNINS